MNSICDISCKGGKMKTDELYSELVYKAKKIDLSEITFPDKFSYIQK